MALIIVEIDSDKEARSLVEVGEADFVLVRDVTPGETESDDQPFCRVFACRGRLADVRRKLGWNHPPDRALGDDFVVAWDLGEDEVRTALRQEFGG